MANFDFKETFLNPIFKGNPISVLVLGICSSLAVTVQLKGAFVMGLSVIIVGAKWKYLDIDAAIFNSGGVTYSVPIYKKKNVYLYIVRKNGGNAIQGWTFFLSIVSTNIAKKFLNIFAKNLGQRLRYKQASDKT